MRRILIAAAAALVALAPPASAQAPVFVKAPDVDILVGEQHVDTPPTAPKVGDKLWGNNGSPFCDPKCDPNDPSQQPQPFQTLLPGNGEPPSGQFFSWNRCLGGCVQVQSKSTDVNTYVVKPEDAGAKLQFVVWVTNYDCGEVVRDGPDKGHQECRWTTTTATALTETVQQAAVVAVSPGALADGEAGAAYSQTVTASGGTGPYSFAVTGGTLPPGLTLSSGGLLSGTPTQAGSYTFTVQGSAAGATPGSRTYTLVVRLGLPSAFGNGVTGVAYTQSLTAVGAPGEVAYSVAAGQLPDGLTVAGAQIAGTPTKQGDFTFTLNAVSGAVTTSKQYAIHIAYPVLTIAPSRLPRAVRGVPYEVQLVAAGGSPPYSWSLLESSLPRGLSLKPDGRVVGIPRTTGDTDIGLTFQVRDQYGAPATAELRLEYHGPVLTLARADLISVNAGVPFTRKLRAGGGAGPYVFRVVRGELPRGLRLARDGTIRGTTTQVGTTRVGVRVTDRLGAFAIFPVRIEVVTATAIAGRAP